MKMGSDKGIIYCDNCNSWLKISQFTNKSYSFTYFSRHHFYMVVKLELRVNYNSQVFLGRCPSNIGIIEQNSNGGLTFFLTRDKNDFLGLFVKSGL